MADIVQRALEAVEENKVLWFAAEKRATELAQDNERLRKIVGCMVRTCSNPPRVGEHGVTTA